MLLNNIILKVLFDVSVAKLKVYCLLIKSEPTGGFNLKSSHGYSVNDEKSIETNGKILIRGIVGL
jgi:hypothetical protein